MRIFHNASIDHRFRAAYDLLGRLKHDLNVALQALAAGVEHRRNNERDGDVSVVSTCVHYAGVLGWVIDPAVLLDRKRVDIGTVHDRSSRLCAFDQCDYARLGN